MTGVNAQRARIFVSYKRDTEPDEPIALQVHDALEKDHNVFIDQRDIRVGMNWAERIEHELRQSDFLITFLSDQSVHSEMVLGEIEKAHHLAKESDGRPAILPVRVSYREPFNYPLSAYLNHINWAFWESEHDTSHLIEELKQAISGESLTIDNDSKDKVIQPGEPTEMPPPLPVAQLELPEGTMDYQSAFYVERSGDQLALDVIKRQGVTITIKGPRQMGKSSLLRRLMEAATEQGKRVVFLDFQLFDKSALTDAKTFFHQFCGWLTDELGLENRVDEFKSYLSITMCCTRYVERCILKQSNGPITLAMDEVDRAFDTDFRSDFFGMLRSWHNKRAMNPSWKYLDLALVTSTEPYQFITDLNQSPFNVGQVIDLEDFTLDQVSDLNHRHGSPLTPNQVQKLVALVGGHPYLVRKALYLVSSKHISTYDLFAHATDDRGPFGDHLRYHLFRMHGRNDVIQGLLQVIQGKGCQDPLVFFRLRGAGLVRKEGNAAIPRCQLYADYFRERLNGS
jgi:hypothetical protein